MGFSILPRNRLCSIIISCFRLGFRGLSPYSFGILFHHPFPVSARVPGLVSLLLGHPVPSSVPGSGLAFGSNSSGVFLFHHDSFVPGILAFCSIIVSPVFWFRLGSGDCLPSLLAFCSINMSWFHLVPGRVVRLVSLVLRHCVPS